MLRVVAQHGARGIGGHVDERLRRTRVDGSPALLAWLQVSRRIDTEHRFVLPGKLHALGDIPGRLVRVEGFVRRFAAGIAHHRARATGQQRHGQRYHQNSHCSRSSGKSGLYHRGTAFRSALLHLYRDTARRIAHPVAPFASHRPLLWKPNDTQRRVLQTHH